MCLTHWGRVTNICVIKLTIIGSDNGFSPGRRQAIIWTSAWILLIGPLGTNFSENLIEILTFSFTKMRLKVSSAKCRPFWVGLNVLNCHTVCHNFHCFPYHTDGSNWIQSKTRVVCFVIISYNNQLLWYILAKYILWKYRWTKDCSPNLSQGLTVISSTMIPLSFPGPDWRTPSTSSWFIPTGSHANIRFQSWVCYSEYIYTVQCRYNAVNFLENPYNRHPIARPSGRAMGCLLWF